ncbi:hypothetical protein GCM10008983_20150 [Lentibacillus halophilus]|uniref:Secreted protein n=1 Tax=Lentibacillus halophilus TaxID=295065 RepID=A0ABP3J5M7_9BACI
MRSLIVLLLLILFFLTGLIAGMDRGSHDADTGEDGTVEGTATKETIEITTDKHKDKTHHEAIKPDASDHFIQKAASFLEACVTGVYEGIVRIAYQLANVFF